MSKVEELVREYGAIWVLLVGFVIIRIVAWTQHK